MPRTTDGGFVLDDSPSMTEEEEKLYTHLMQTGKHKEAAELYNKVLTRRAKQATKVINKSTTGR